MINEQSIIVNIPEKITINKKRFHGLNINNYEINLREDIKTDIYQGGEFFLKDLYESEFYKKQGFNEVRAKIKRDKVKIQKVFLNNSEL